MKKFIVILISVFVSFSFVSCNFGGSVSKKQEREKFVRDSIIRAEFVRDSIERDRKNAEIIKNMVSNFIIKGDEFSTNKWVLPKSKPKYRNQNGVYTYFELNGNKAENFRFVFQYYADDWLFIKKMTFNIDDELFTIVPDMDTDCGYGGKIWEWCDESVTNDSTEYSVNENFIKKLANAKSVKVKLSGRQYYDTKTLTETQIKSIKQVYNQYVLLGGEF